MGKSTFFQAITNSELGNPANYPFATIEPEEARVIVPSPRLEVLQKLYQSQKQVPATLTIYDIAGLTKGASKGEGLGNQFLNDIRSVDGIFQVVRGFADQEITHIEGTVDAVRDLNIVKDELILKDLEFVESALEKNKKKIKYPQSPSELLDLKQELQVLSKAEDYLIDNKRIASIENWSSVEVDILSRHNLLTAKPVIYLLNVSEQDFLANQNQFVEQIQQWIQENSPNDQLILVSATFETAKKNDPQSVLPRVIQSMRKSLHLLSFFTCGNIEAREWTVRENSTAPDAAGVIHTDLKNTFISAEVIKYADLQNLAPAELKSKGKITKQGKGYLVQDGDIMLIKAAGAKR